MDRSTVRCPQGHDNPIGQPFCGGCGASLAGVCPDGHTNPSGQHFCGQCGLPLSASLGLRQSPETSQTGTASAENVFAESPVANPALREPKSTAPESGPVDRPHGRLSVDVGATFTTGTGQQATIRAVAGGDVWVDVEEGGSHLGTFRFPIAEVETALTQTPPTAQADPAVLTSQCVNGHTNPSVRTSCRECGCALSPPPLSTSPLSPSPLSPSPELAALPGVCSKGHHNPTSRTFCRECGEPLPDTNHPLWQAAMNERASQSPRAKSSPDAFTVLQSTPFGSARTGSAAGLPPGTAAPDGGAFGNFQNPTGSPIKRLAAVWQRAGGGQRVVIVVAAAAVLITLLFGTSQCSRNQQIRNECARMVDNEFNYKGKSRDEAISFCVRYTKDFGVSS